MKFFCWFKHAWSDWTMYINKNDRVTLTYKGKKVMDYMPGVHFRSCARCGEREEHDLRNKPYDTS